MNLSNTATALIQATNIVLLLLSYTDTRRFIAWRIDKEDPQEVLTGLQISSASVDDSIKLFEHPLESGAVITDHYIIDPQQANIGAVIDNSDQQTLKELEYLHVNGIPLKIRVDNKVIPRVVIKDKPFNLTGQMIDKNRYSITFREEEEVEPVYVAMPPRKVRNQANASRVNSGIKQAQPVKKSWAKSLFSGGRT